jgi:dUTP pyrophosphatase
MWLTNAVGVIDSGFRGEVTAKFALKHNGIMPSKLWHRLKYLFTGLMKNCGVIANYNATGIYNVGDRVAQMIIMPYPKVKFQEVEELSETERGEGGYGSTGK